MTRIVAAALLAACLFTPAAQAGGVKIGMLTCWVEGRAGYLIGSAKNVDCKFEPSGGGHAERYTGTIGKIGLDVGITDDAVIKWVVFAPGARRAGALKGSYSGVSAEATAGVGLGANALVGGFRKNVNLQPFGVQAQTGLNLSLAVTNLTLRYDR